MLPLSNQSLDSLYGLFAPHCTVQGAPPLSMFKFVHYMTHTVAKWTCQLKYLLTVLIVQ